MNTCVAASVFFTSELAKDSCTRGLIRSGGTKYIRHLMFEALFLNFMLFVACVCSVFEKNSIIQLACFNWTVN